MESRPNNFETASRGVSTRQRSVILFGVNFQIVELRMFNSSFLIRGIVPRKMQKQVTLVNSLMFTRCCLVFELKG